MPIRIAYSASDLPEVVWELAAKAGESNPQVILFFASSKYDPAEVSHAMQAAFPEACVAGCTTAGEIADGKMSSESIAAMFLDDGIVGHRASAVVEGLSSQVSVRGAVSKMEQELGAPVSSLDIEKYVGIVLADGLSGSEEALMEKIGDYTDLLFVGGSAGDDLKFAKTHVMLDGKAFTDAAVLLLLEIKNGFDIVKTQSFRTLGKTLVATKVDEVRRLVEEFDHQPALTAYAQALGVPPAEAPSHFMKHPLGLMIEKDPYVRSPQRVQGEGIVFYCQIKQGMKLEVLEGTDIVAHTLSAIEARKATGKPISGIIDFQCILRALQLREEGRCDQYGAIFAGIPTVGFSTYGEAYLGHINQTSTMLVFR